LRKQPRTPARGAYTGSPWRTQLSRDDTGCPRLSKEGPRQQESLPCLHFGTVAHVAQRLVLVALRLLPSLFTRGPASFARHPWEWSLARATAERSAAEKAQRAWPLARALITLGAYRSARRKPSRSTRTRIGAAAPRGEGSRARTGVPVRPNGTAEAEPHAPAPSMCSTRPVRRASAARARASSRGTPRAHFGEHEPRVAKRSDRRRSRRTSAPLARETDRPSGRSPPRRKALARRSVEGVLGYASRGSRHGTTRQVALVPSALVVRLRGRRGVAKGARGTSEAKSTRRGSGRIPRGQVCGPAEAASVRVNESRSRAVWV